MLLRCLMTISAMSLRDAKDFVHSCMSSHPLVIIEIPEA